MRSAIYHRGPSGAVLALFFCGVPTLAAAEPPIAEAWVEVAGPQDLPAVEAVGLTVAEGHRPLPDGRFEQRVLARSDALDALSAKGFRWRIERADHRRGAPRLAYRPPDVGDAYLAELVQGRDRAGLVVLGESEEGRPITAIWLGEPPEQGAPTYRILGAHHGDEWSSFEVALDIAGVLAEDSAGLLDDSTVWIVPYVNPDGVVAGSRYNASGVDLNRNYDVEWTALAWGGGDAPFSEAETRAVRTLAAWAPPLASLSLHAGAENIGYPWNFTTDPTPEEAVLDVLAGEYAARVGLPGFVATNGADWYLTNGDTNDWSYGRYGGMDFTVELSADKVPDEVVLADVAAAHRDAILAFLATPPTLSGRVVDAETSEPIEALVRLERADAEVVFTTTAGRFHRIVQGGAATLTVWAPGYESAQEIVQIGSPTARAVEVALVPRDVPEPLSVRVDAPTPIDLPGASSLFVRLVRPAHADVVLPMASGIFVADPADLAPGAWSIVLPDGTAWPRALFVEDTGPARLDTVERGATEWVVHGAGFAPGARAWALEGPRRTPVALEVRTEDADTITLDPRGNEDLILLSNGTWMADLVPPDDDDTGATDTAPDPPGLVRGSCSCATGADPLGLAALALAALLSRRRR